MCGGWELTLNSYHTLMSTHTEITLSLTATWQRIHVDFVGPFGDHVYLVVVDAHAK